MGKYDEFSGVKVVLEDILEYLDELKESVGIHVLRGGDEATDIAIRHEIGKYNGLDTAITRLQLHFGAEQVNEYMPDTRY